MIERVIEHDEAEVGDQQFFDTFMLVLGALVGFSILVYVVAGMISDRTEQAFTADDPTRAQIIAERLAPVARVNVAGQAAGMTGQSAVIASMQSATPPSSSMGSTMSSQAPAAGTPQQALPPSGAPVMAAADAPAGEIDGQAIYQSACALCHQMGVAGAPKFGDAGIWAPRIDKGMDLLYSNAINGYVGEAGVMPAKGGRADLSDDEVRASVDYMVEAVQ